MPRTRKIIVGITGASGAPYARRLLQMLHHTETQVHVVITDAGRRLLSDELNVPDVSDLAGLLALPPGSVVENFVLHHNRDIGSSIASGSFPVDAMVIVPCSGNTLAAVAAGLGDNLLRRAAAVTLKERRHLILCHRETPLSLPDVRNMASLTEAGAVVMPLTPGFYLHPRNIDDLVDFMVGRILDQLGVEHQLDVRWQSGNSDAAAHSSDGKTRK